MSISHQTTFTIASTSSVAPPNGYDNETGNTELTPNYSFPANTTNGAVSLSLTAANIQDVWLWSDKGGTLYTNNLNGNAADVQTITINGTPTGGTFPIAGNGSVVTIAYNANNAAVQTALQLLYGAGNVTCTNGPLPGTPVVCTFNGSLAAGLQALMVTTNTALTGGSSPTVTVSHTTPGVPSNVITLKPGIPVFWGASTGYGTNPFTANVSNATFACTTAARLQGRILTL